MKHKFLNYLTENDIRVLIFDKDGTLTDTSTLWFEPTILVLDELVNRNEMNLTNAEHDELFNRLGITETNIIENSVIASGSVRDMLEVLNQFRTIDIEENYNFVVQYFADYIFVSSRENPNAWKCREGSLESEGNRIYHCVSNE